MKRSPGRSVRRARDEEHISRSILGVVFCVSAVSVSAPAFEWRFKEANCVVALPEDGGWIVTESRPLPEFSLTVECGDGDVLATLTILRMPGKNAVLDDKTIDACDRRWQEVERTDTAEITFERLSRRRVTFKGVPACELLYALAVKDTEGDLTADGRVQNMLFVANGYFYALAVTSFAEDGLAAPEVEDVLEGFSFLTPPAVPDPDDEPETLAYKIGYWGVDVLLIVVVIYVARKGLRALFGRKRPPKA